MPKEIVKITLKRECVCVGGGVVGGEARKAIKTKSFISQANCPWIIFFFFFSATGKLLPRGLKKIINGFISR